MVAIGIIGVLSAVAIPAYQGYQATARRGVVESLLRTAARATHSELSISGNLPDTDKIWEKVESSDKGDFQDPTSNGDSTTWCFNIEGKSTEDYNGLGGCVDQDYTVSLGGDNLPCSGAKYRTAGAGGTPSLRECPTGCIDPSPLPNAGQEADCGGNDYTQGTECTSGGTCSFTSN